MNLSFKIIDLRFDGFWNLPIMIAVTLGWLVFLVIWNRPTSHVIGKVWSKRFLILRIVSGVILLLYLFNPTLVYLKMLAKRGKIAVLIDTSQSMNRKDFAGEISRLDAVKKATSEQFIIKELERHTDVACYTFDRDVTEFDPEKGFASLKADGDATDISAAFQHIRQQQPEQGWSGAILFTDGRNTAPASPLQEIQSLGSPVYTIGVGKKNQTGDEIKDRSITRIQTNPTALIDQKNQIRLRIRQTGFNEKPVTVFLEEQGKTILEKSVSFSTTRDTPINLDYTPKQKGLALLKVKLASDSEDVISENDSVEFTLPVTEDKIKVLYTEGALRWEYKFLKRSLSSDPNLEPVLLIRTTADQAFTVQGEGKNVTRGFPESLKEMQSFQCVILGDMPRAFITDRQISLLEKFVGEHGGGLVITGGYHILCSGEYTDTPLETLLPVKTVVIRDSIIPYEYSVIPEQKSAGVGFQGSLEDWEKIRMTRWYPVGQAKPGAQVLLERRTKTGEKGILAAQQTYGKGRVLLLASDEFWKPAFAHDDKDTPAATERFYLEGIRWVANQPLSDDKNAPLFTPRLDQVHYDPGTQGVLHVEWNPNRIKEISPNLQAELVRNKRLIANLEFRRDNPNNYTASFPAEIDGNYEIRIQGEAGEEKETQVVKFIVGRPYREVESYVLNENLLTAIAQKTRGGYYNILNAKEIVRRISKDKRIEQNRIEREWASQPGWMILFLILMNMEWFLRRRKGLL